MATSGLKNAVAGLPVENPADGVRLPFAHHQLQAVAQRDQPALAGKGAHLAHMVHVYNGIAVHALRRCLALKISWMPRRPFLVSGKQPKLDQNAANKASGDRYQ